MPDNQEHSSPHQHQEHQQGQEHHASPSAQQHPSPPRQETSPLPQQHPSPAQKGDAKGNANGQRGPGIPLKDRLWAFYAGKYKPLLIVPLLLMLLSLGIIGAGYASTGSFIVKDVSLKGGATITVPLDKEIGTPAIEHAIRTAMPGHDILVRGYGIPGQQQGVIISADIDINSKEQLDALLTAISSSLGSPLKKGSYGIEFFGSSLGASFFRESLIAMLVAFALMALVVFVYFRTFIPSVAIILAAVGDMLVALAFLNLFHIPIGTAGIAAFLMLIGYSVDTDILLTIRVLKRKEGTVDERIASSIKTGVTQTAIAILAMGIGFAMAQSDIIRQIMLILIVGLTADLVFTWIQNVGLLRYYLGRKGRT